MKYLAQATVSNVSILLVVMRWLDANGPASYEDLATAVRPPSLVPEADNALRATLEVASHIGLLGTDNPDGDWRIVQQGLSPDSLARHDRFRALVRRALLDRAVRDYEDGAEPSDVALGLTWLCSLDPSRPLGWGWDGDDGTERVIRKMQFTDVITNSTQWRAFRRWAVALGFATDDKLGGALHRLTADATTAIADCLPEMQPSQTAREFMDGLAVALPTVDGGVLETALRRRGIQYEARAEASVGPVVGHALERLNRRGWLRLQKSDDARQRVSYRIAGQTRSFDRVMVELPHD